jgi:ATP-dependent Clp protease ATP-binding subunit ClpC
LSREEVENIARKELGDLAAREGLAAAGIQLEWSERLVTLIARDGYDHQFGARPLQRAIEQLVVTPLARWKVANAGIRNRKLQLDVDESGAVFIVNV